MQKTITVRLSIFLQVIACVAGVIFGLGLPRPEFRNPHHVEKHRQMPEIQIDDSDFPPLTEEEFAKLKIGELIREMDKKEAIIIEVGRVARHGWSDKQKAVPAGTCRICGNPKTVDLNGEYCDECYHESTMLGVRSDEMLQRRTAK